MDRSTDQLVLDPAPTGARASDTCAVGLGRSTPRSVTRAAVGLLGLVWSFGAIGSATTGLGKEGKGSEDRLVPGFKTPLRDVRVHLASDLRSLRIDADGPFTVTQSEERRTRFDSDEKPILITLDGTGGLRVNNRRWGAASLTVATESPNGLWLVAQTPSSPPQPNRYPGLFRVSINDTGSLDVLNLVDVEAYVSCVVAREAWPTFHVEAFKVQAVVARTFVLYEMLRRQGRKYDVTGTQGSQVYQGYRDDATGRRAADATRATRGLVLTWNHDGRDEVFCSYYSAACGGVSQSADIFGEAGAAGPLRGGVRCDYCKIAPGQTYRWGPVQLSRKEVFQRLVNRYPNLQSLEQIKDIRVIERTSFGRPTVLRIVGVKGASHDLLAERFRHAIGPTLMRSTDCRIRVRGSQVLLDKGRGFGHGLGLCQWGSQGQALEGKLAGDILRYYFPGAKLTRVY